MYTLALRNKFIALHQTSDENPIRSHLYLLEVMLETEDLDDLGMVHDLDALEDVVEDVLSRFRDQNLVQVADFGGASPTLEMFARVLGTAIDEALYAPNLTAISVRLWRDEQAWALFDIEK